MKRMLNTLYVTTEGAYLARAGKTLAVRHEGRELLRVPLHTLDGVVCVGRVSCSPGLLESCGQQGVTVTWLSEHGRFRGRFQGPVSGNVLLRRTQYRYADDPEASAGVAWAVVAAKLANCRAVLQRAGRDRPQEPSVPQLQQAAQRLTELLMALRLPCSLNEARGWEGEAAQCYFGVFDHLIVAQKEHFHFGGRNRRPPRDKVNALLSFLYALLAHDCTSALESVGLDPAVGFLHRDRSGRASLALDLMEELRPVLADRLALSLINRRQVRPEGFVHTESGAVRMDDETRKALLVAYQKRKQEELRHPFLDEKIPLGMVPFAQALLLSRFLRGDLDGYPAFLWR